MKSGNQTYRVIIADDHSLIRQGIKSIIADNPGVEVVAEAASGIELLQVLEKELSDLIILDLSMPDMNGLEAVEQIKKLDQDIKVLVVTMHGDSQHFFQSIAAGVHGYLIKEDSDAELIKAIEMIRAGKTYVSPQLQKDISGDMINAFREQANIPVITLSAREKQVLELVVQGHTSKSIAGVLNLSPRTVDHHRASLIKKFNMKNTVDLVNYVVKNNLV